MDIASLRTFVLLAETKSFTKTAELLHVVQPTVSSRIRDLETELGKPLFERNNRRVDLTVSGELYMDYARRIINLYEESKNKIACSKHFSKTITIGCLDIIWRCALHDVVKKFLSESPDVSIHAINYSTNYVTQLLIDRTIDIAFVCLPVRTQSVICVPAFYEEIILACSPMHPFAKRTVAELEDLYHVPLVYGNIGSTFDDWFERNLRSANNLKVQFDITALSIPFITDGFGPGLVPKSMVINELRSGELKQIPLISKEPLPRWISYMAYDRSKNNDPEIQTLIRLIQEC